jgi:hypothetical protein
MPPNMLLFCFRVNSVALCFGPLLFFFGRVFLMLASDIEQIRKYVESFELSELHSAEDWNSYFDKTIKLLASDDLECRDYAVNRLQNAVWAENSQKYREPGFNPPSAAVRLAPILNGILSVDEPVYLLMSFLRWGNYDGEHKEFLEKWLASKPVAEALSADVILVCKIMIEMFDADDWSKSREFLEPLFDHQSDLVRAAAAAAIGDMYNNDAAHLPPLADFLVRARDIEIERPGFAGPFIGPLLMNGLTDSDLQGSGIVIGDWMLEIIAKRKSIESDVPFYNGIDFYAHEHLSTDSRSIARLIEYGAEGTAAMAATEEDFVVDGLQPLLEQLANSGNDFIARICAWHLAYHYRFLHPGGVARGFVGSTEWADAQLYFVYDREAHGDRPYAAAVYPKEQHFTDEQAWRLIDMLVPPAVRPPMEDNDFPYKTPQFYEGRAVYVYGSYFIKLYGDSTSKIWTKLWVKWPLRAEALKMEAAHQ